MLKRLTIFGALVALVACQKGDPAMSEKLDRIEAKIDSIGRKADGLGRGAAPRPQQQPRGADPSTVYSVAIGDAPVKGPASAKVTIIEAAEFA